MSPNVGTRLALVLWLVRAGEASNALFVTLVSVVIEGICLDERLGRSLLLGVNLVVCGIYLANRTRSEKSAEP